MNTTTVNAANAVAYDGWTALPPATAATARTQAATPATGSYSAGIDQVRYWVGAMLTAAIAALVGVVGLVLAHGIIHVPVLAGAGQPVNSAVYGLAVAGIAVAAAALFVGMLHVAPRPVAYFGALAAMVTALATLLPFTSSVGLHSQIALAAMNLAAGVAIMVLVPMAAVNARR